MEEGIESIQEGASLQWALRKRIEGHIGSLKRIDTSYTETGKEMLELLLRTHFLGLHNWFRGNSCSGTASWHRVAWANWDIAKPIINTSPGMDGILSIVAGLNNAVTLIGAHF